MQLLALFQLWRMCVCCLWWVVCRQHLQPTAAAHASLLTETTSQSPARASCAAKAPQHWRAQTCCSHRISAQMQPTGFKDSPQTTQASCCKRLGSLHHLGQIQVSARSSCPARALAQPDQGSPVQIPTNPTAAGGRPRSSGRLSLRSTGRTSHRARPSVLW